MKIKITPLLETLRLQKIDDSEYFSEKYSNYISNSRLGLINPKQEGNPEKFFNGFKPIYSSSLDIGTTVHSMILQRELFNIVDSVDKPTGKMGAMAEELYKIWDKREITNQDIINAARKVDYYKGNLSINRINEVKEKCENFWKGKKDYLQTRKETQKVDLFLDSKSRETSYACIKALENNKQIQKILYPKAELDGLENPISEFEQAILLDIRVDIPEIDPFILRIKAKLDNYIIDKFNNEIQVNDIKTLGKILSEFSSNIEKYRYNRELAMYSWLLTLVAEKFYGVKNPTIKGHYLVVSTIPDYYSKVVQMSKKDFIEGFNEFKYLLKLVAYEVAYNYKEFGIWGIKEVI